MLEIIKVPAWDQFTTDFFMIFGKFLSLSWPQFTNCETRKEILPHLTGILKGIWVIQEQKVHRFP